MDSYQGGRAADHRAQLAGPSSTAAYRSSRHGSNLRHSLVIDEMSMIPESEAVASRDPINESGGATSLLNNPEQRQEPSSQSLFRRLTTRLTSPITSATTSTPPPIPLTTLRSLRNPRHQEYQNLHDVDDDYEHVPVDVDLSVISGLGFQVTELEQPTAQSWLDQDTTYQSPTTDNGAPPFQTFVRQLGAGLVVGAQVTRNPSVRRSVTPADIEEEMKRNRTVRHAAQKHAQERNVIVAISESVDLSFLEGHAPRRQTNQTFDTMFSRSGTMDQQPQSYFFPNDPNIPSWRPMTMSSPYILFLISGAFALAGCQEYLFQKSELATKDDRGLLTFNDVAELSVGKFFVWKYLPTMITIIYAVLFSVMDFDIRRLEPFYQMSQPKGSPASESLNVDHLTMFQYLVPFKAFRLRQWTVFLSTIGNIIASTASPALQNPSVDFKPNPACRILNDDIIECASGVDKYVVVMTPVWSRLLMASYLVVGLIGVLIFFQLRRKTGLLSDPKGIAGIASMATKSHILREFKGTDTWTRKEIQKRLEHRRFVLYKSSIWQGQWNLNNEPEQESARRLASPHPPMLQLTSGVIFILIQVGCLVAVPVISLTKANVIPNKAPWLPILVATVLKLIWSTFEADVRLMEPFYRLSLGHALPEHSLTLDYQSTVYGFLPLKAAYNGHWLVCMVGLCSMALDVLSVTVSSFSVQADIFYSSKDSNHGESNGDETKLSFWVSVVLSMAILLFVIIVTSVVYLRRRHPFLPREPSTIASVLAFIYASNMLVDFIDTERLTNKQMEEKLKNTKKTYALGWVRGRDGEIHCAIDEEPIRSKYVHGTSYRQALAGPIEGYYGI